MKVDVWFDYNDESFVMIQNLNQALNTFQYKEDVKVVYRSFIKKDDKFYHELFHYGRKKQLGLEYLCDCFSLYKKGNNSYDDLFKKYNLSLEEFLESKNHGKLNKIICNHVEHADLMNLKIAPTLTFSYGYRIEGLADQHSIKDTLIKMYEKESGIEYCEGDDCER